MNIHNTFNKVRKGFTLVEVLIVAIIIAILASVMVTSAFNARKSAAESTLSSIVTDVNKTIQRAALASSDEAIPCTISGTAAGTAIKQAIAGLAWTSTSNLGSVSEPYQISVSKPASSGANATPLIAADSAKKMIDLINQYFDASGNPYTGTDREIKYRLQMTDVGGLGSWGKYQFYLNPVSNQSGN